MQSQVSLYVKNKAVALLPSHAWAGECASVPPKACAWWVYMCVLVCVSVSDVSQCVCCGCTHTKGVVSLTAHWLSTPITGLPHSLPTSRFALLDVKALGPLLSYRLDLGVL